MTVRRLVEIQKTISPDLLFLKETKNSDDFVLQKLHVLNFSSHKLVPPQGRGGGLALLWNQNVDLEVLKEILITLTSVLRQKVKASLQPSSMVNLKEPREKKFGTSSQP